MSRAIRWLIVAVLSLPCGVTWAQSAAGDENTPTIVVDMGNLDILGTAIGGPAPIWTARVPAVFDSLIDLRRTFMDEIQKAVEEEPHE